ncbi:MAG: STAS domain-containing protein [Chitinophagaceae bacterium]|nr:STAS domain-containing protein [Rubrivivax sp.]
MPQNEVPRRVREFRLRELDNTPFGESIVEMTVTERPGPTTLVHLQGRLDAAGSDAIGLRFTTAVAGRSVSAAVDLSDVSFVASLGLRLLILTARALAAKGHRTVLFGANELVQGVFDDAALDQLLPIVATEAEALAILAT